MQNIPKKIYLQIGFKEDFFKAQDINLMKV